MQKVKIWILVYGDYSSFYELDFTVLFDITNNIQLDDYTLEYLEANYNDWCRNNDGRADIGLVDAILFEGKYYWRL